MQQVGYPCSSGYPNAHTHKRNPEEQVRCCRNNTYENYTMKNVVSSVNMSLKSLLFSPIFFFKSEHKFQKCVRENVSIT